MRAAIREAKPVALLALLLPLVGIGLLVWAVRSTLRYRKYGVSRLELSTIPGVVGRTLTGMVRAPARMQRDGGFQVMLSCVRRLQVYFNAPLVFPIVTGLLGLLILIGVLDLWLQVSRVTVDAGTLTWASGYLFPGRERTLPGSEIAGVVASIGMQAGTTVYYDVAVVRKSGRKIKVGWSVRDKREAEWLAAMIKKALR